MKGVLQTFASLIIALIILLGILFLPDSQIKQVRTVMDFFSGATQTIYDLGGHILQNFVTAVITGLILFLLIRAVKRKTEEDRNKIIESEIED